MADDQYEAWRVLDSLRASLRNAPDDEARRLIRRAIADLEERAANQIEAETTPTTSVTVASGPPALAKVAPDRGWGEPTFRSLSEALRHRQSPFGD